MKQSGDEIEVSDYNTIKFKCGHCGEGQYYSKGEPIRCPYCHAEGRQVLVELEGYVLYIKEVSCLSDTS